MKALLGGKGANLAEMAQLDIPVPPGFTITTDICTHYYQHSGEYPLELKVRSKRPSSGWRGSSAVNLATLRIHCLFRCVPGSY